MTYIKNIRIRPIRGVAGTLMWQLTYDMCYNGFWFQSGQAPYITTKQAFDYVKEMLDGKQIKVISS